MNNFNGERRDLLMTNEIRVLIDQIIKEKMSSKEINESEIHKAYQNTIVIFVSKDVKNIVENIKRQNIIVNEEISKRCEHDTDMKHLKAIMMFLHKMSDINEQTNLQKEKLRLNQLRVLDIFQLQKVYFDETIETKNDIQVDDLINKTGSHLFNISDDEEVGKQLNTKDLINRMLKSRKLTEENDRNIHLDKNNEQNINHSKETLNKNIKETIEKITFFNKSSGGINQENILKDDLSLTKNIEVNKDGGGERVVFKIKNVKENVFLEPKVDKMNMNSNQSTIQTIDNHSSKYKDMNHTEINKTHFTDRNETKPNKRKSNKHDEREKRKFNNRNGLNTTLVMSNLNEINELYDKELTNSDITGNLTNNKSKNLDIRLIDTNLKSDKAENYKDGVEWDNEIQDYMIANTKFDIHLNNISSGLEKTNQNNQSTLFSVPENRIRMLSDERVKNYFTNKTYIADGKVLFIPINAHLQNIEHQNYHLKSDDTAYFANVDLLVDSLKPNQSANTNAESPYKIEHYTHIDGKVRNENSSQKTVHKGSTISNRVNNIEDKREHSEILRSMLRNILTKNSTVNDLTDIIDATNDEYMRQIIFTGNKNLVNQIKKNQSDDYPQYDSNIRDTSHEQSALPTASMEEYISSFRYSELPLPIELESKTETSLGAINIAPSFNSLAIIQVNNETSNEAKLKDNNNELYDKETTNSDNFEENTENYKKNSFPIELEQNIETEETIDEPYSRTLEDSEVSKKSTEVEKIKISNKTYEFQDEKPSKQTSHSNYESQRVNMLQKQNNYFQTFEMNKMKQKINPTLSEDRVINDDYLKNLPRQKTTELPNEQTWNRPDYHQDINEYKDHMNTIAHENSSHNIEIYLPDNVEYDYDINNSSNFQTYTPIVIDDEGVSEKFDVTTQYYSFLSDYIVSTPIPEDQYRNRYKDNNTYRLEQPIKNVSQNLRVEEYSPDYYEHKETSSEYYDYGERFTSETPLNIMPGPDDIISQYGENNNDHFYNNPSITQSEDIEKGQSVETESPSISWDYPAKIYEDLNSPKSDIKDVTKTQENSMFRPNKIIETYEKYNDGHFHIHSSLTEPDFKNIGNTQSTETDKPTISPFDLHGINHQTDVNNLKLPQKFESQHDMNSVPSPRYFDKYPHHDITTQLFPNSEVSKNVVHLPEFYKIITPTRYETFQKLHKKVKGLEENISFRTPNMEYFNKFQTNTLIPLEFTTPEITSEDGYQKKYGYTNSSRNRAYNNRDLVDIKIKNEKYVEDFYKNRLTSPGVKYIPQDHIVTSEIQEYVSSKEELNQSQNGNKFVKSIGFGETNSFQPLIMGHTPKNELKIQYGSFRDLGENDNNKHYESSYNMKNKPTSNILPNTFKSINSVRDHNVTFSNNFTFNNFDNPHFAESVEDEPFKKTVLLPPTISNTDTSFLDDPFKGIDLFLPSKPYRSSDVNMLTTYKPIVKIINFTPQRKRSFINLRNEMTRLKEEKPVDEGSLEIDIISGHTAEDHEKHLYKNFMNQIPPEIKVNDFKTPLKTIVNYSELTRLKEDKKPLNEGSLEIDIIPGHTAEDHEKHLYKKIMNQIPPKIKVNDFKTPLKTIGTYSDILKHPTNSMEENQYNQFLIPDSFFEEAKVTSSNNFHPHAQINISRTDRLKEQSSKAKTEFTTDEDKRGHISFEKYNTEQEINSYLKYISSIYESFVNVLKIGETVEGRPIHAVKLSKGGRNNPIIILDGGIHAREWISPATVLYVLNQLVEDKHNSTLLNNKDWILIPLLNPDGYVYSMTKDRMWRKNRRKPQNVDLSKCYGVDLNRNFGVYRGSRRIDSDTIGASDDPCASNYRGPSPFSEPESRALRDLILQNRNQIKLYISFHSYGNYLMYPWSYKRTLPSDWKALDTLATAAQLAIFNVTGTRYAIGSTSDIMGVNAGGSDDWVKGYASVKYCYTVELPGGGPRGFDLPTSQIHRVAEDMFEGVKVFSSFVDKISFK